ncbi:hypothetical protein DFP72DRAFT_897326 [Ephemerocybe angulata]|uniref:Uncharacterized protein n=1 Tax=Ephemerocybe angulata TaxID=980116 RepID=A0A8H6I0J2_9AGAR|nr:hypothetical protein DFP72DRAFT_897326 [Tulosesus angulatus]
MHIDSRSRRDVSCQQSRVDIVSIRSSDTITAPAPYQILPVTNTTPRIPGTYQVHTQVSRHRRSATNRDGSRQAVERQRASVIHEPSSVDEHASPRTTSEVNAPTNTPRTCFAPRIRIYGPVTTSVPNEYAPTPGITQAQRIPGERKVRRSGTTMPAILTTLEAQSSSQTRSAPCYDSVPGHARLQRRRHATHSGGNRGGRTSRCSASR